MKTLFPHGSQLSLPFYKMLNGAEPMAGHYILIKIGDLRVFRKQKADNMLS
jgi:hypothetical protein